MGDASEGEETKPAAKSVADPGISKWIGLGMGAGIGSAAVAAALLYATRTGRSKGAGKR